jgi:hypothetical protein
VEWVIYLCAGPSAAARIASFNDKIIDIDSYSYPLYVGYIYSEDSTNVKWHAEVDFAEFAMRFWSRNYSEYPLMFQNCLDSPIKEIVPGSKKLTWYINDPEFLEAAVLLMQWDTHMRPIRWQRGVPIDKKWKPVFPKQVRIVGTPEEARNSVSAPVRNANGALKPEDYIPINWDSAKNEPLGNRND